MKTIYCDLKAGMTREEFLAKASNPDTISTIEVCFDTKEEMDEFDAQCMCFAKEKHHSDGGPMGENNYIIYELEDLEELERNISYLVTNCGWHEEDY